MKIGEPSPGTIRLGELGMGLTYPSGPPSPTLPFSTTYDVPGTYVVPVPAGAVQLISEGYAAGSAGNGGDTAGGGAAYSKKTIVDFTGIAAVYIVVPDLQLGTPGADAVMKANNSGGATLMLAKGGGSDGTRWHGGQAVAGVGDVKFSGGNGIDPAFGSFCGGGAAGPNGNGGNAPSDDSAPGTGNGGLAGDGGFRFDGNPAGGGGGFIGAGGRGAIVLSWS